jgi:peroxiredoxin
LKEIQAKSAQINAAGIDIVAISADDVAASSKFIAANGFTIPIASNLTADMMRQLGLFVSSPKGYVPIIFVHVDIIEDKLTEVRTAMYDLEIVKANLEIDLADHSINYSLVKSQLIDAKGAIKQCDAQIMSNRSQFD